MVRFPAMSGGADGTVKAFVGLGANLGEREACLRGALERLAEHAGVRVLACSGLYETEPVGYRHQPPFLNAVACLETDLPPEKLLDVLMEIEQAFGRRRTVRWGPRTLDLDLLLYGDRTVSTERLTVPHPRMYERAFVLVPLLELKELLPPRITARAAAALASCGTDGVTRYKDEGWTGMIY